jgi:hypothetical protein
MSRCINQIVCINWVYPSLKNNPGLKQLTILFFPDMKLIGMIFWIYKETIYGLPIVTVLI